MKVEYLKKHCGLTQIKSYVKTITISLLEKKVIHKNEYSDQIFFRQQNFIILI